MFDLKTPDLKMLDLALSDPSTSKLRSLRVKLFADGADTASILELARNPLIQGFTTNPTLMRQAGVKNYERFCRDLLEQILDMPFSFESFPTISMKWNGRPCAFPAGARTYT